MPMQGILVVAFVYGCTSEELPLCMMCCQELTYFADNTKFLKISYNRQLTTHTNECS